MVFEEFQRVSKNSQSQHPLSIGCFDLHSLVKLLWRKHSYDTGVRVAQTPVPLGYRSVYHRRTSKFKDHNSSTLGGLLRCRPTIHQNCKQVTHPHLIGMQSHLEFLEVEPAFRLVLIQVVVVVARTEAERVEVPVGLE